MKMLGKIDLLFGRLPEPLKLPARFVCVERPDYFVVVFTPERKPHLVEDKPDAVVLYPIIGFSVAPSANLEAAVAGHKAQVTSINTKAAVVVPKVKPNPEA